MAGRPIDVRRHGLPVDRRPQVPAAADPHGRFLVACSTRVRHPTTTQLQAVALLAHDVGDVLARPVGPWEGAT